MLCSAQMDVQNTLITNKLYKYIHTHVIIYININNKCTKHTTSCATKHISVQNTLKKRKRYIFDFRRKRTDGYIHTYAPDFGDFGRNLPK